MITIDNLTEVVCTTLKMFHIRNDNFDEINVKEVTLLNEDTLCCNFYPVSKNSNDFKLEIAIIMGFFNGFFRDTNYAMKMLILITMR